MEKGKCYIVGAGETAGLDFLPTENDFVIAADGGYRYLLAASIKADIVIGDFDSLGCAPVHPFVVQLKSEKDETDVYEALKIGLERGYREFVIYGGTGGRIEHTFANIQLLNDLANRGCRGTLVGINQNMTVIKNSALELNKKHQGRISVFSLCEKSAGVNLEGLKYPLCGYTMTNRFPIGVSNEFMGKKPRISVEDGELLIIYDVI